MNAKIASNSCTITALQGMTLYLNAPVLLKLSG